MGIFDDLRSSLEQTRSQQVRAEWAAGQAHVPAGGERPVIDHVTCQSAYARATLAHYLGVVGLRPEDSYGIWPDLQQSSYVIAWNLCYRDRPEYADGRARWAQLHQAP